MSSPQSASHWLTIAIPTMRRWSFLQEQIPIALSRPEVAEVILCDETGEDVAAASASPWATDPKLRLVINPRRLGIYQNKRRCIELAAANPQAKMVAVLDSDNAFNDEWFETLSEAVSKEGYGLIYASADFMTTDTRNGLIAHPCREFSGRRIQGSEDWNLLLTQPRSHFLTNDGNWVLPAAAALTALPATMRSDAVEAADAIYMMRCFIAAGLRVWYVPGLEYIHRVHPGSSWLETEAASTRILNRTDWRVMHL